MKLFKKVITSVIVLLVCFLFAFGVWKWMNHKTTEILSHTQTEKMQKELQEKKQESKSIVSDGDNAEQTKVVTPQAEVEEAEDEIQKIISRMTIKQKIAQMFMITPEQLTDYNKVTSAGEVTRKALEEYQVGGIILFANNIETPEQLKEMTGNLQKYSKEICDIPLFLGIDEEGGSVARIADNPQFDVPKFADMKTIGQEGSQRAYEVGASIGQYLKTFGFNLDFAPVADVLTNPENTVVQKRAFSNDATVTSDMVLAEMKGLEENNIYACLKHFPGHGGTSGDTHRGYSYTSKTMEELKETELVPFQKGIEAGVSFIMVSHISVPNSVAGEEPASLSRYIQTQILRNEMKYDGIIITDAMNMGAITEQYSSGEAAVKAIQAGTDIVLMPEDFKAAYQAVIQAVEDGVVTKERIDQSVERILRRKMGE